MSTAGLTNGTFFEIFGTFNVTSSAAFKLEHDDGAVLELLSGGSVVAKTGSGDATVASSGQTGSFSVSPGVYSFELLYSEVNGAPAVLEVQADAAPGPIPGTGLLSFVALGLLGLASAGRKKFLQRAL
jgi:hypothetical protein